MRHKDEGGSTADVRFGSKAHIGLVPVDVRFTPESGHWLSASGRLLCAKSGHMRCSTSPLSWELRRCYRSSTRYGQNRHYLHRFAREDCKVWVVFKKLRGGLV